MRNKERQKEYLKEYLKEYYLQNKEKISKLHKQYYLQNKAKIREYSKEYRLQNREMLNEHHKRYRLQNKNKISDRNKRYRLQNKNWMNEYFKNRIKTDINFKLSCYLRNRLYSAVRSNQKTGSAIRDLGCTVEYLKKYLESQFQKGMTWDNWSITGWHIDHQIPLSIVDLTNRENLKQVCHYTNLQPMWANENIRKRNLV